jgi:hypothetical protein
MRKAALLFAAGALMELIWAVGTLSLQHRIYPLAFLAAASAPYVAGLATAVTVVDEPRLRARLANISWYAAGACVGLAVVLCWW